MDDHYPLYWCGRSCGTFNTAIERLVDLVSPERHPIAGQVKDIAAGAVLVCAVAAAIIGGIIFIPYLF
ncbi:MAG: diacylglycerol kinase [Flavonifractor plautii]